MPEIKRCDCRDCANHLLDDRCQLLSVYLINRRCSGYRHKLPEPQPESLSIIVHEDIRSNCRRKGGKWRQWHGRVWR